MVKIERPSACTFEERPRFVQDSLRPIELAHECQYPSQPHQRKTETYGIAELAIQLRRPLEGGSGFRRCFIEESAKPEPKPRYGELRCVRLDPGHGRFQALHSFAEKAERRPQWSRSAGQIDCDRCFTARSKSPIQRCPYISELRQVRCSPFRF